MQPTQKSTKIQEKEVDFALPEKQPAISSLDQLQFAIADAVSGVDPDPYLEVTETLMRQILRGQKSAYVTYHGVKLYIEGTRDRIVEENKLNPEAYMMLKMEQAKQAAK